ncbi:glycosyltransferase family 4 protein [Thauera sp.]|jgi:glycosyltransferase involved in cell wall biosynthesis|uniref:glycosyltransferase family 4 protein n=1 Tax=Thauera sp. TaxID=1905334 RepID=UPI002A369746|nr:glycosyltransferase family 4 protein [Thauera sp.]MDX9887463.1 glycosyltransferase family 4 protein [Thauera sp.]
MKPLKVLQLLPALDSGGVERGTLEIARALVAAGHESVVLSKGGRLVEQLQREGSRHIARDLGRKSPATFLQYRALRKLFEGERFDIIHARSRLPAWVAWLAWRGMPAGARPHFVTTVHGMHSVSRYSAIMCAGERVIVVSDTVRDYIRTHYPPGRWPHLTDERITVIPRGIDPAEFPREYQPSDEWVARFRAEFPQIAGRKVLTLPGRLTRLKGHHDFITIVGKLVADGLDVVGLIVGGEDPKRPGYAKEIRERVQAEGLGERIVFTGHRSDVREIYAVSECVLSLSSTPESFGRTVLEPLAMGRPVVGYAHGGVAEILGELFAHGAVAKGDVEAAARRVADVLAARTPVVEHNTRFLLAKMQAATLSLYSRLHSQHRA